MTRNLAYDGVRGWLLIVIACNHLFGNYVTQITRSPLGFVSAAEGFVFLSGFVGYLVYRRFAQTPLVLKQKIWSRTFTIYKFHICAVFLTFLLITLLPIYNEAWQQFFLVNNWYHDRLATLISTLLLLEHPGFHDILILYIVPMLFLPFAILALKRGRVWLVVCLSLCVWGAAHYISITPILTALHNHGISLVSQISYFDPLIWQVYFYSGVVLSFYKYDKGNCFRFSKAVNLVLWLVVFGLFITRHWSPFLQDLISSHPLLESGIRLINLLVVAWGIMHIMRYAPAIFHAKYPVFLGQHALAVFTFHAVVIYFLLPATQPLTTAYWYWDVLLCAVFVVLLWLPAKIDEQYVTFKRKKHLALARASTNTAN